MKLKEITFVSFLKWNSIIHKKTNYNRSDILLHLVLIIYKGFFSSFIVYILLHRITRYVPFSSSSSSSCSIFRFTRFRTTFCSAQTLSLRMATVVALMTPMTRVRTSPRMTLFAVVVVVAAATLVVMMTTMMALMTSLWAWTPACTAATSTSTLTTTATASTAGAVTSVPVMAVVMASVRPVVSVAVHRPVAWLATLETRSFAVLPSDSCAVGLFHYDHVAHNDLATHLLDGLLGALWIAKVDEREPDLHDHSFYGPALLKLLSKTVLRDVPGKIPHVNTLCGIVIGVP